MITTWCNGFTCLPVHLTSQFLDNLRYQVRLPVHKTFLYLKRVLVPHMADVLQQERSISTEIARKIFKFNTRNYGADKQQQKRDPEKEYRMQKCTSTSKKYSGYAAKHMWLVSIFIITQNTRTWHQCRIYQNSHLKYVWNGWVEHALRFALVVKAATWSKSFLLFIFLFPRSQNDTHDDDNFKIISPVYTSIILIAASIWWRSILSKR